MIQGDLIYYPCCLHRFVIYFMSRVELLRGCGIEVVIIFDGCRLPMKAEEEETRRK